MASNDVTFALKLTADSKELVAQLTLSRDALAQLGLAARDVGADAVAAGKSIVDGLSTGAAAVDHVSVKLPALSDSLATTGAAGAGAGNQIDAGMTAGAAAAAGAIPKIQQVGATLDDTRQAAARSAAQFDYVFGRAIPQAQGVSNEIAGAAMSTRQLAFALRGVPAQFTDIATSLIAGQPPMMVLLQQGGQLKDMFGGIGPAARALGGYVAGLVNPFTVAAASAAVLALAYYQGSEEADGYRNALILTGNAAGTTAGQLQAAAQSVSAASGVTQAAAAEIVTALAQTGKIGANNLGQIADAAARMERAVGDTVAESVKQFSELGAAPVAASIKLNETTNYLTESVYRQIKALEEQGRTAEAGALAQTAWADAMGSRADEILGNLGTIERSWLGLKDAAKGAWDAMLDVGRKATLQDQLEVTGQRIAALRQRLQKMDAAGGAGGSLLADGMRARLAAAEREEKILQARIAGESHVAAMMATENAHAQAAIALSKESEKYLDKETQKRRELLKLTEQYLKSSRSAEAERDYLSAVTGVTNKFAERQKTGRKVAREIEDAATVAAKSYAQLIKTGQEYTTQLTAEYEGHEKLTKSAAQLAEARATLPPGLLMAVEAELSWAQALESSIDAEKRDFDQAKEINKAQKEARAELNKAEAERIAALDKSVSAAHADALAQQEAYETYGLSASAIRDLSVAKLEAKLAGLDFAKSTIEEVNALEAQIAALKEASAWAGKRESKEAARQAVADNAKAWDKFADDIERSLTDSLMRGFESGKGFGESFVDSLKNTLKTTALKVVVQALVDPVMGGIRGVMSGSAGSAGSNLLGLASNASSIYSAGSNLLNLGVSGAAQAASFRMAGMGASQSAMLAEQTAEFGMAGTSATLSAAGSSGAMSSVMAAAPYAAALFAAYQIIAGMTQGETRQGQHYGYGTTASSNGPGTYSTLQRINGPSGGDIAGDQMQAATTAALAQTNAILARYGVSVTGYQSALESSEKGRGGVYAGGTLSTGATFGESGVGSNYAGTLYERTSSTSPDSKAAAEAYALDLSQSILQALRAADIGGDVGALLATTSAEVTSEITEWINLGDSGSESVTRMVTSSVDQIEQLTQAQADALVAAASGAWLDDLLLNLDESALGFTGVADAAVKLAAHLPVLAQQTGLTAEAIGTAFHSALTESASAAEAGQIFADSVVDGVYNAMQSGYEQQITGLMMDSIINPVLIAVAMGGDVAAALSAEVIDDAVVKMSAMADAYNALLTSPEFTAAMDRIRGATSRTGTAAWVPDYNAQASRAATAAADAAESSARAAEDAARAMLAAQTSLVDAQVSLIQGLQSAAQDWRALSMSVDQDMLRLSRLNPDFDAVGYYTDRITGLLGDWHNLVNSARDPDSLSYQSDQVALAEQIHRAAMDRYDAELEALKRASDATRALAQSSLDLRRYVEGLRTGDLSPLTMGQKLAAAASQYQATLLRAQGGDMDARARLSSVSDTYLKLSQGYYAGASADYSEIFRSVTSAIDGLAQPTRSTEELLSDIRTADDVYNTAALDIARRAQSDLAVIKSVTDTRLAEVNASVVALGGSLRGYLDTRPGVAANTTIPDSVYTSMGQTAPVAATVSNPDGRPAYNAINMSHDQIRDIVAQSGIADGQTLYREIVRNRLDPYAVGAAYGLDRGGMDAWLADQQVVRVPGFEAGGDHAGGLRIVGERGIELEATGPSRIWSADDTRRILAGGGQRQDNSAVAAKLQVLIEEVQRLRTDNERLAEMVAQVTARSNEDAATTVAAAVERSQHIRQPRAGSVLL